MSVYPSVTKSVFRSVHKSLKVPPAVVGSSGGGGAFDPDLSGIQSRILDDGTIWTDEISSKYYLKDQSTDNTHLPRQGRAWLFDGSNDYGTLPAAINSTWANSFSISFWTYYTGSNSYVVSVNNGVSALINIAAGSMNFGNTTGFNTHSASISNIWIHWVCVYDSSLSGMSRWIIYKNSALASVGPNGSLLAPTSSSGLVGIRNVGLATPYGGFLRDLRIYSSAKDSTAVSAIYNQSLTGNGTFDETNLVACYPCNEEAGTIGYDISGNANHLTLTNITEATFHSADTGVLTNRNNDEGYRLSGSVYIPKRLSSSLAADGNALTVTGRAAYHGCAETPCVTNHTGTVYIAAAHLTGSETVVSFSGSTTTPTISAGRIDWQSGQTLSDLTLSDGTRYTMQEGPGSGNTNRTVYNVNGSTNHGTLTNGTVATIWGTRLTGTAKDWCILYGGRIGAAGEFVPGRVSGSLAADGSAKTLVAGKFGNPFSRLNLNPATAAEFNGRSVPTAGEVGDLINGTITPDDTGFNRVDTDGDDRFLIYEDTLTGADLTNVENYVS